MAEMPSLEAFERLLKSRPQSNVTVKTNSVSVTVNPRYQLLEVTIDIPEIDRDHRDALQSDLVKAINEAMQTAALAAAHALEGLSTPPEVEALKAALQKQANTGGP